MCTISLPCTRTLVNEAYKQMCERYAHTVQLLLGSPSRKKKTKHKTGMNCPIRVYSCWKYWSSCEKYKTTYCIFYKISLYHKQPQQGRHQSENRSWMHRLRWWTQHFPHLATKVDNSCKVSHVGSPELHSLSPMSPDTVSGKSSRRNIVHVVINFINMNGGAWKLNESDLCTLTSVCPKGQSL